MIADRPLAAHAAAFVAGTILWSVTGIATSGREMWDTALYWNAAYPAALLIAAGVAVFHPVRPWRWCPTLMLAQIPVMLATESGLSLLPLGLALLAMLSLPAMLAASIAGWLRLTFADG